uniref:uncharacterized protein LOC122601290 n=1 Tax=Erigeron canadensis TaxID=72917 RepID=UPI001CB94368|nr:uncharacterized protein LOC122601290 [Erigeron canadensis]
MSINSVPAKPIRVLKNPNSEPNSEFSFSPSENLNETPFGYVGVNVNDKEVNGASYGSKQQSLSAEEFNRRFNFDLENFEKQTSVIVEKVSNSAPTSSDASKKVSFRFIPVTSEIEGVDIVIPIDSVKEVTNRFSNSLYGYFLGDRLAFPVVENYVKNTWAKFGLKRLMMNDAGFFFFQFSSKQGMEQVLEKAPWMIRSTPLLLNVWTPNTYLSKQEISSILVWVDLYDVPLVAFTEDGLSMIASKLGKPKMLDSYTSQMCVASWGRHSFARALIEIDAKDEMKHELTVAIPNLSGEGFTKHVVTVEYEWQPPHCSYCTIFGHDTKLCPLAVNTKKEVPKGQGKDEDDGFIIVKRKRLKGKNDQKKIWPADGFRMNKPKQKIVYREKQTEGTSNQGNNGKQKDVVKEKNEGTHDGKIGSNIASTSHSKGTVNISNQYSSLADLDETEGELKKTNDTGFGMDSDDDEVVFDETTSNMVDSLMSKGASTPGKEVSNEFHLSYSNLSSVSSKVFSNWSWISNCNLCNKGTRILVGWDLGTVDVMVLSQADQVIHTQIRLKDENKMFMASFVYAHNHYIDRRALWNSLSRHKLFVSGKAWCILGDFNATLSTCDTAVGASGMNISTWEFRDCVENLGLVDVNRLGLNFTWNQNPRGSNGVLRKIDRIIADFVFQQDFVGATAIFKPYLTSDHTPAILKLPTKTKFKPKPFRFANLLVFDKKFQEVVQQGWNEYIEGFKMYIVVQKLKLLKKPLWKMLVDKGNLHTNVIKLRTELEAVQVALDNDPHNANLREYCGSFGNSWTYFEDHHCPTGDVMISEVTDEEVKQVVFSMGDDKSPGPDGSTAAFFKSAWGIIGKDITVAVQDFFLSKKLLKELNHTKIALVPKVSAPSTVTEFRPISLCNILFKCISKIIANRIKDSLSGLVSINQSAFIPGRTISDNILLTQDIMHNYHLNRGPPRCAFKVDIQKAYDTVDWGFLNNILIAFGFPQRMIDWIMLCVSSASYSLSINGFVHGYFRGKRGSDDLFIFMRGDVDSAQVIIASIDEFKAVSGLAPSLPKSTAYFCNVRDSIKRAILEVLPFEEGRLPVKYLGVPLVSSRLVFQDCKLLVEQGEMQKGKAKVS